MSDEKKQTLIPLRDFIYLCIILGITLIAVISYFLGDSTRAGENLNFAATAISVVLAVIAIIMTIVDSAGQKQNVFDLKKAIEVMQETLEEEKMIVAEFREQLSEVEHNKIELMNEIRNFISFRDEVKEIINQEKDGENPKNYAIEEINKVVNNYDNSKYNPLKYFVIYVDFDYENASDSKEEMKAFVRFLRSNGYLVPRWRIRIDSRIGEIGVQANINNTLEITKLIELYENPKLSLISIGANFS